MERSRFGTAWAILLLAAGLLLIYPMLHRRTDWLSNHFRTYNFFGNFFPDTLADTLVSVQPDTLQPDTLKLDTIQEPLPPALPPPTYAGKAGLQTFYEALRAGNKQIRIAYYGDSAIEGDLICQTLRDSLQRRFGGTGVGLVPIDSPVKGFRMSIRHNSSTNWYRSMIGQNNSDGYLWGIMGEYFLAGNPTRPKEEVIIDSAAAELDTLQAVEAPEEVGAEMDTSFWATYRGVNLFSGLRQIPSARLFYSAPIPDQDGSTAKPGKVQVRSGEMAATYSLNGKNPVNELWLMDSPVRQMQLFFDIPNSQPIFGVSLESNSGVIVDNIPSRGNRGGKLMQVPYFQMNAFDSLLDYNLIILQFGLNALAPEMKSFGWYKAEINNLVTHIKQSFPNASILLIGPTDRAIKEEAEVTSDPSVVLVTKALREVASRQKVGFFSFYEAMGGRGTMIDWVEKKEPRWANLDYTHLNFRGAHVAGKMLLKYLLSEY